MNEAHRQILCRPAASQHQSPLFRMLPGEVRSQIFALALTDYPDPAPEKQYAAEACYTRPSYFSPRRTDTQLLRTCRAVYRESWHMPFTLKEQLHWVADPHRAPPGSSRHRLRRCLRQIAELQSEDEAVIARLRVFAQMYKLEEGGLASLLRTPFLRPRAMTLTIRHADWWFWEDDEPLRFEGRWIRQVCEAMPNSVGEMRIELESLQRKKQQVDGIAKQMAERWFFKRPDGVVLHADTTSGAAEASLWRGTSTWHQQRWVRDETEPGQIDYYVVTVSFRPEAVVLRNGGSVSDRAKESARRDLFDEGQLSLRLPGASAMRHDNPSIWVGGVDAPYLDSDDETSAEETSADESLEGESEEWEDADENDSDDDNEDEGEGDDGEEDHDGNRAVS